MPFLSFFFSKSPFSKNSFRNTIRVSNGLVSDQAQHFVGPDLGPNCLKMLSADDTSRPTGKLQPCFKRVMVLIQKIPNEPRLTEMLYYM